MFQVFLLISLVLLNAPSPSFSARGQRLSIGRGVHNGAVFVLSFRVTSSFSDAPSFELAPYSAFCICDCLLKSASDFEGSLSNSVNLSILLVLAAKFVKSIMGEEKPKNVDADAPPVYVEEMPPVHIEEVPYDVAEEKSVLPLASEEAPVAAVEKTSGNSIDRDAALERLENEKRFALIKAWEENEKSKVDNKAHRKLSAIDTWENSRRASVEAQLTKKEEKMEKRKAEYAEKMRNKAAGIHKTAEEKRAYVDAKLGEGILKVEETAAKYRAARVAPKKFLGCFGS